MHAAVLCCLLVLLASCALPELEPEPEDPPPDGCDREFFAIDFKTEKPYTIYTDFLYENARCIIYKDWKFTVNDTLKRLIGDEYINNIYPRVSGVFGEELDVDGNGKVIIVLMDIRDNLAAGNSYVAGYFFSDDMYKKSTYSHSNEGEILYMDVKEGNPGNDLFYATLAHEFQHLLRFSDYARRWEQGEPVSMTETWLNEGLSTAAEYIYYGGHLSEYEKDFNNDTNESIRNGNTFYVWDDSEYSEYVTAYLFFQWLRIQAGGKGGDGYDIYREICKSGYSDYRAVLNAAVELFDADADVDSWEKLLGAWFLANYLNTPSKSAKLGLYGYNNEVSLTVYPLSQSRIELRPGEGVYSIIERSFSPSTGSSAASNIRYIGAAKGSTVDKSAPYTGQRLLTFNANPDLGGYSESGELTGVKVPAQSLRFAGEPPPALRRVDGTSLLR
jgi:hypothetical protein